MSKRIAAAVFTFAILAVTYGICFAYFSFSEKPAPKASAGFLDLCSWRFPDDGIVRLDGEWTFYPGRLLTPEDFAASSGEDGPSGSERI